MKRVSKRYAAILILLIPSLLLILSALSTADSRVGAQANPSATPCEEIAPPFNSNGTSAPTSSTLPCLPTATPTVTMTLLPPNTDPTDGTSTPSGAGPESQSASLSCPNNGPTWAVIAAGGEACFIEAIRYSNALPASAPPYQIYITGALTFDGVTRFIPDMRRGLEIWGNNSWFTVSADNPLTFLSFSTGEPYLLSHLRITNEGNKRNQAYGGAIRNAARLRIYDSVFDNNAAENGGGAILSSAVLPNPPSSLHLERVHFTNNRAGGGGAIQMDYGARLTGDCVMFENNSNAGGPPGGYGQSVLLGSFGGSVSLTRSGMRTRYVTFAGGGTYPQLYNLTTAAFTVSNNYIKAAPQPPL